MAAVASPYSQALLHPQKIDIDLTALSQEEEASTERGAHSIKGFDCQAAFFGDIAMQSQKTEAALISELRSLKLSVLQRRAADAGATCDEVKTAFDEDDPKSAFIALILSKRHLETHAAEDPLLDSGYEETDETNRFEVLQLENESLRKANIALRNRHLQEENARLKMSLQEQQMMIPTGWPQVPSPYVWSYDGMTPMAQSLDDSATTRSGAGFGSYHSQYASSSYGSTTAASSTYASSPEDAGDLCRPSQHEYTTVMMRNIPNNYTREQLLSLLDSNGYHLAYDLLYLPIDFENKVGLGYAFINFRSHDEAERFRNEFYGYCEWEANSEKICQVTWSSALQGTHAHIERYRNSPVMHESVPDEFKPMLFDNGNRIPFPKPTKRIRPPQQWQRKR